MYVPLKITSEYTLLNSTIKIDDLILFLEKHNITSCALIDKNLCGVMEFYQKMLQNNLKPIIGLNIEIDNFDIYLYAKNYDGYRNLLKIHTLKEFANLSFDTLKPFINNIKIILPFKSFSLLEILPDSFLGYSNDTEKIDALLKTDKIVYVKNVQALEKEDTKLLDYLEAINKGTLLNNINTDYSLNYLNLQIKEDDELTTFDFINDINLEITNDSKYIPKYNSNIDSYEFLVNLTKKGLNKRLSGNISNNYLERLNYELNIINKMGFVDYFLIVYDYVLHAKKNNILVGPGRGSAAGSLVSFCLGITNIDPIKYDLLFERFLNPERVTMPDIDIDFEYTKRGEVIDYVRNRYGKWNVAPIMTFGTLGSKQVIRDLGRVLNFPLPLIDSLAKIIDAKKTLEELKNEVNIKIFLNNYPELKEMFQVALKIEGLKRHISTHAAGVVISSVALDEVIPILNNSDTVMTGITMEYLENLGLLKMDFLALKNLTIIANVLDLIKENTGKTIDLNRINLDDKRVFKLFCDADTEGIFQYESSGMKNLMKKLKPSSFSDLVASVALFRPGPMENIDLFIRRKYGQEKIVYLHPDLEQILKETYGVIVYQEQVMQILVKIGGYSYAEADLIRRAMSKKKASIMEEDKKHFIANALKKGYAKEVAISIYDLILKFANYGFNKAHSVSYALIGYQMAYLKINAPLYFIANLLNMSIGSDIKTKEYINEARSKGIKIIKPDINKSINSYLIKENSLMLPLSSVKNLGTSTITSIIEERNKNGLFKDYLDFVSRVYKNVNKKILIALIEAGFLDSFNITKRTMIENIDIVLNYADLITNLDASFVDTPELVLKEEYDEAILREKEYNSYGFYLNNHPACIYQDNIIKLNLIAEFFDKHIKCAVLVEKVKTIKTKKGDNMAFLTCSDETGTKDFVLFPTAYYMLSNIHVGDMLMLQGKVTKRFDTYQINIDFLNKINN